jgi:hypothetical protein
MSTCTPARPPSCSYKLLLSLLLFLNKNCQSKAAQLAFARARVPFALSVLACSSTRLEFFKNINILTKKQKYIWINLASEAAAAAKGWKMAIFCVHFLKAH